MCRPVLRISFFIDGLLQFWYHTKGLNMISMMYHYCVLNVTGIMLESSEDIRWPIKRKKKFDLEPLHIVVQRLSEYHKNHIDSFFWLHATILRHDIFLEPLWMWNSQQKNFNPFLTTVMLFVVKTFSAYDLEIIDIKSFLKYGRIVFIALHKKKF